MACLAQQNQCPPAWASISASFSLVGRGGIVVFLQVPKASFQGSGQAGGTYECRPQPTLSLRLRHTVITQRESDKIDTFVVDKDGVATGPIVNETTGVGLFGFTFTQRVQWNRTVDSRPFRPSLQSH